MTGPNPIHIVQVPGVGDELLKAVAPLLEVIQRKRELALQREQVSIARAQNTEREREFDITAQQAAAKLAYDQAQLASQGQFLARVLGVTGAQAAAPTPRQGAPIPEATQAPTPTGPLASFFEGVPATAIPGAVEGAGGVQRLLEIDEDKRIHDLMQRFDSRGEPWTRENVGAVVRKVAAINVEKAGKVAVAFGGLLPDYAPHVNDDGSVSWIPKNPGGIAGASVQPKPPTKEQIDLGEYGTRLLSAHAIMTRLEHLHPNIAQKVDDRLRPFQATSKINVLGGMLAPIGIGPAGQILFSPAAYSYLSQDELEYLFARSDFANAILRKRSGATINLEELDREMGPYTAPHGTENNRALVRSMQNRRLQTAIGTIEFAGPGFDPNRLTPLARKYLAAAIATQTAPAALLGLTPQEKQAQAATSLIQRQFPPR